MVKYINEIETKLIGYIKRKPGRHIICNRILQYIWRKRNMHNNTRIYDPQYQQSVEVGNYSYGTIKIKNDVTGRKLKIGNFCSIAEDVFFLLGIDHETKFISTFPIDVKILNNRKTEAISKGDIIINDDVWIGHGAIILSGVTINQGAIVAAGSIVTKDIPPYAIVGGIPAKIIKYRFDGKIIEKLNELDYGKLSYDFLKKNRDLFYHEIEDVEQIDEIICQLNKKHE